MVELYDTLNAKWCPNELLFGNFRYQPITPVYYYLLNDIYDGHNNTPGNPIDDVFLDAKGV